MKSRNPQLDHFDGIVTARLFAADFAQPKHDFAYYREKSIAQIQSAIKNIAKAHTHPELIVNIAQANAFVDAAYNLEFIDLSEKNHWLSKVRNAYGEQVLEA